jgi:hypothetical protein
LALEHVAYVVHHDNVVVVLGPVNSTRDSHSFLQSLAILLRLRDERGDLMEALEARHLTSLHSPRRPGRATVYIRDLVDPVKLMQ